MNLSIHIPQFEGPLALLLYLIRKEEMDIFDIDVQLITSQYLDYIKKMKQFDLEVAGDFIAMAATLIQIKSKMLLPNYNENGEEEEVEDPRKELVQRLVEYQKFQEISKQLYDRPLLGRDVFRRGKSESIHSDEEGEIILDEGGLFALIAHYRNSVRKMKKAIHRVATKTRSIAGRILEIKDKFIVGQRIIMRDLIGAVEDVKSEILITFLSCLELGKMGYVSVYQSEVYGDIYLTAKRSIDRDVVGRVEEYETPDAEGLADALMEEAAEEALLEHEAQIEEPVVENDQTDMFADAEFASHSERSEESLDPSAEPQDDMPLDIATDEEIELAETELNITEEEVETLEPEMVASSEEVETVSPVLDIVGEFTESANTEAPVVAEVPETDQVVVEMQSTEMNQETNNEEVELADNVIVLSNEDTEGEPS